MRILVIGAHPDDEVLGAGGTICYHVAKGDEVYICIVTKAYEPDWPKEYMEKKIKEQKEVDKLLGIKKRFNLDLSAVKLNTIAHGEFNKKIANLVETLNPDILYTHFEHDLNYDHTLIFRASMVAARPPKMIRLLCYETLTETEWGPEAFKPNIWIDISRFIDKKIDAFKIYKSEVKPHPNSRNEEGIRTLARKRGMETGLEYAEGFRLFREVIV